MKGPRASLLWRAVRGAATTLPLTFPLTLQGVVTLLLCTTVLSVFGYGAMDLVVFALTICALSILIFCLFCVVISGLIIQRRVQRHLAKAAAVANVQVESGYPNETGFSLPGMLWFPLIRMSWRIIHPDRIQTRIRSREDGRLREEIIPRQRCLTEHTTRLFTVSDVMGFCRYSWRVQQAQEFMSLPQTQAVKALPLLRSLTAEDGIPNPSGEAEGDRMEIRPYAPGDSVRNIMWKVYARNRQLNVRLPERSVTHSRRTVAYLLSSEHDEAAAAVARVALETGALGEDWSFGADGSPQPCDSLPQALRAVARSRALQTPHSYGLDRFLDLTQARQGVHCIVFAAAERAAWNQPLIRTIASISGRVSLVLATDGLDLTVQRPLWQRLLLREDSAAQNATEGNISKSDLLGLLTEFGQFVESTLIIDRHSGQSFDRHLNRV